MIVNRRTESSRRYREKHKDKVHKDWHEYYLKNKEKILAYQKAYREKEKAEMTEEDLELRRAYRRAMYQKMREENGKDYNPRRK